jgi:hypothetical protein
MARPHVLARSGRCRTEPVVGLGRQENQITVGLQFVCDRALCTFSYFLCCTVLRYELARNSTNSLNKHGGLQSMQRQDFLSRMGRARGL